MFVWADVLSFRSSRYLCHESSTRNGHVYEVGAGWVARVRWERARGVVFPDGGMDLDAIAAQIDEIEVRVWYIVPYVWWVSFCLVGCLERKLANDPPMLFMAASTEF